MPIKVNKPYWETVNPATIPATTLLDKLATGYPTRQSTDKWCDWAEWYNNIPADVREDAMREDHETMIEAHTTARDPISAAELYHKCMAAQEAMRKQVAAPISNAAKEQELLKRIDVLTATNSKLEDDIMRLKSILWDMHEEEVLHD